MVDKDKRPARVVELTEMVNDCKQAVDDSQFGPLMLKVTDPADVSQSKQVVSAVAFPIFQMLLQGLLAKYDHK